MHPLSNDWYTVEGPLGYSLSLLGGVHSHRRKSAARHKFDMVWLYRSPIPVGRAYFTPSNDFYLPSLRLYERGKGSAPCAVCMHQGNCCAIGIHDKTTVWFLFGYSLAIVDQGLCALCLQIRNGVLNFMSAVGNVVHNCQQLHKAALRNFDGLSRHGRIC